MEILENKSVIQEIKKPWPYLGLWSLDKGCVCAGPVEDSKMDLLCQTEAKNTAQHIAIDKAGKDVSGLHMWNSTRKLLTEFYKPWNEKLATLLDDNRFLFLS